MTRNLLLVIFIRALQLPDRSRENVDVDEVKNGSVEMNVCVLSANC